MKVSHLFSYPVKSLGVIGWESVALTERGLAFDRHWMVVDHKGRFMTQRHFPQMTQIQVRIRADGLELSAPSTAPLFVPGSVAGSERNVSVWDDKLLVPSYASEISDWLTLFLGREAHLVYMPLGLQRTVKPIQSFADGFPVLILGQGSLDDLSERCGQSIDPLRFRPNILISGVDPFEEDHWGKIKIGDAILELIEPCSRCAVPSLSPLTGERSAEPNASLRQYRLFDGNVYFGQNANVLAMGELRVGDTVEVLEFR